MLLAQAWFLAQVPDPTAATNVLLQYGAVGIIGIIGIGSAYLFYQRLVKQNDETVERLVKQYDETVERLEGLYEDAVERGDRLETALLNLNEKVNSEFSGNLVRATEALRETTDLLRHRGGR